MKKLFCLVVFISLTQLGKAQNLVYNGNFETYTTCPTAAGQILRCDGWWGLTNGTTDYYACTMGSSTLAASGSAFTGIYIQALREYLAGTLATPMQVGRTYEVSVSVKLDQQANIATDDIGIYFFKNAPTFYNTTSALPVVPQVSFVGKGPVVNKTSWLRLAGYVYADSAYDKIVIGSFLTGTSPNAIAVGGSAPCYYYFDSVVVQAIRNLTIGYTDSMMCTGAVATVSYNLKNTASLQNNNIFTLQLSDAFGSFAAPLTLATQAGTTSGSFTFVVPNITSGNNYRMRVTSSNPSEISDTTTVPISIGNILPVKPVITANNPACTGQTLNMVANTSTPGVSYKWTGPNSFGSTLQNPSISNVSNANAGNYIVTVRLYGCVAKDTETVAVNVSPLPIVASSNSPLCQNTAPLNLTATNSTTGAVYSWSGPSFTSGLQNPTVSNPAPAASGDYIVSVTLNGCTEKDTVTVAILAAPTNVNATANTPLCAGQTLTLNVTNNTPGVSYSWSGPSFTANTQNPSVINATTGATGDYITTLSINGCVVKDTVNVVVNPIPTTPTASSNSPVCQGNPINLYATASLPGAIYNWSGPSYTSTQQNPVMPIATTGMSGTYSVSATLNNCTSPTSTTTVNVLYYPSSVSVYVLPNDTICAGGIAQLVAVASNGGTNPQYRWLKNGFPISGATSISYNATSVINKDKYSVILTPDNTCPDPDTSAPLEITVLPYVKPEVSITATPGTIISPWQTITFHATPINGGANPTYQWKRNGQDVVGAVNDTWGAYTLGDNDVISVVLYSSEICPLPATATSNTISITVKLGVDDVNNHSGWNVYPNPHSGSFHLKGNVNGAKELKLSIINVVGQVVHSQLARLQSGAADIQVNMANNIPNGIYLLRIDTGTDIIPVKITLQR